MPWIPITGILFFVYYGFAHPLNASTSVMASSMNISLPGGVTNHDDPQLICTPASWFTVATFFLGNYIAHAGTTHIFPGETLSQQLLAMATSVLYPGAGVVRGLTSIARGILVLRGKTQLQQAASAGALCMVVRTKDWKPIPQCSVHGVQRRSSPDGPIPCTWRVDRTQWLRPARFCWGWYLVDTLQATGSSGTFEMFRNIHGIRKSLPNGFAYAFVPPDAVIDPAIPESTVHLSNSLNTPKILIAIFQTIYSSYTLYESRGDQIQRFGFVAFSLTVAPYTVMSILNLFGGLLSPMYPAVFLVQSEVSDEVEQRHGKWFDGMVGSLKPLEGNDPTTVRMQDQNAGPFDSAVVLHLEATSSDDADIVIPSFPPFQRIRPILSHPIFSRLFLQPIFSRDIFSQKFSQVIELQAAFYRAQGGLVLNFLSFLFAFVVPFLIIRQLSALAVGESTKAQVIWVTMWFGFGVIGIWGHFLDHGAQFILHGLELGWFIFGEKGIRVSVSDSAAVILGLWWLGNFWRLIYVTPAIGGFVVVARMILSYGDCKRI